MMKSPLGWAGVPAAVAATRMVSWLLSKASWFAPARAAAAIWRDAITGMAPPGPGLASRRAGKAGHGVSAARAA